MKILFITSGSIGDVIISTGLLAYLADTYPSAVFTIAVGPAAAPLLEAFPRLERILIIRKQPWNRHWLTLWQELWHERFDLVVDLRGSFLSFFLRTKERKIFHRYDKSKSKTEQLAALLSLSSPPPPPRLWVSEAARRNARALVPEKQVVVIAPKTNSAAKDWPIERFAALAEHLRKQDTLFVVLASAAQQSSVQPLIKALPQAQALDLSGRTDLPTAYAIMERAQLFIGNDSGLLHMAAAAGIPCVGIYGPSNDKTYAPRGAHVRIVTAREFIPGEEEKRDNSYMQMISVGQVEETVKALGVIT